MQTNAITERARRGREAAVAGLDERVDELTDDLDTARDVRDRVTDNVRSFASAAPYAAFGAVTQGAQRGGELVGYVAAVPRRLARATTAAPRRLAKGLRRVPERVGDAFRESEQAGRDAVDRILGRKSLTRAQRQIRAARSKAKSATTSASRAVRASADAAEAAAEAAIDPRDTRPYEERTRGELYELACERDIAGRSTMKKKQLIQALRRDR